DTCRLRNRALCVCSRREPLVSPSRLTIPFAGAIGPGAALNQEPALESSSTFSRQGHRLLQVGVALFLFTSLEGFAIPYFAVPRLGLSVHTLSSLQGVLLLGMGLLWPRLELTVTISRVALWFLTYSSFVFL